MTAELALAEERERLRISRGLHDQVGQVLGVARVKLGQALTATPSAEVAGSRRLVVTVSDDGAGFDAAGALALPSEDGGFGLFEARERLEPLRGSLEIDSTPGRGARVAATCPLAAGREGPG